MFLFILLIALVQTRFWHFVGFGSFFPCFDVVSLHFLLVACHSHFPSVLDLCVFFPVVAQTVLAFLTVKTRLHTFVARMAE